MVQGCAPSPRKVRLSLMPSPVRPRMTSQTESKDMLRGRGVHVDNRNGLHPKTLFQDDTCVNTTVGHVRKSILVSGIDSMETDHFKSPEETEMLVNRMLEVCIIIIHYVYWLITLIYVHVCSSFIRRKSLIYNMRWKMCL
jgi:hypothetical protein